VLQTFTYGATNTHQRCCKYPMTVFQMVSDDGARRK
jgi:hypothetical protein